MGAIPQHIVSNHVAVGMAQLRQPLQAPAQVAALVGRDVRKIDVELL